MAEDQPPQDEHKEKMKEKLQEALKSSDSEAVQQDKPVQKAEDAKKKDLPKTKEEEIQELTTLHERTIAALSYFGFLAIVPFYLKKESKFCRYHGKQGMTLAIIFFLFKFISVLDLIMDLILILQAIIAMWMGFVALSGKWKRLPIIYKWSVQLEEALSLKTKDEEKDDDKFAPNEMAKEEVTTNEKSVK